MDSIAYDSCLMEIVKDYHKYHDQDRLWKMCMGVAEEFDDTVVDVLNDVDQLYVMEFGDEYE